MDRGFEHPELLQGKEAMRGHPTAPGGRDPFIPRRGLEGPGINGQPGVPRLIPTRLSHGPGIPGPTPSGPTQPGVRYEGEPDQ